jgi:hypothetical protein
MYFSLVVICVISLNIVSCTLIDRKKQHVLITSTHIMFDKNSGRVDNEVVGVYAGYYSCMDEGKLLKLQHDYNKNNYVLSDEFTYKCEIF